MWGSRYPPSLRSWSVLWITSPSSNRVNSNKSSTMNSSMNSNSMPKRKSNWIVMIMPSMSTRSNQMNNPWRLWWRWNHQNSKSKIFPWWMVMNTSMRRPCCSWHSRWARMIMSSIRNKLNLPCKKRYSSSSSSSSSNSNSSNSSNSSNKLPYLSATSPNPPAYSSNYLMCTRVSSCGWRTK